MGRGISRRHLLQGIGATIGAGAIGCGDDEVLPDAGARTPDAAARPRPDAAGPPDAAPPPDAAVPDATPLTPAELLGEINTFVVLMMENRSFDHYYGSLQLSEGRTDIDGLTGAETNPDPVGDPVSVYRLEDFTPADPPHSWDASHNQWNDGANDGFVIEHAGPDQVQVMGYHERDQLPILYALADAGAVCDRWFCSLLGPTWPNRYYLHGATSNGVKSNLPLIVFDNIFDRLSTAGVSHVNYFGDIAWATGAYTKLTGLSAIENFFDDAAAGTLPQFVLIDPSFFGAGANDDHPDHDIRWGQALIASVYAALAASPQWNNCLFAVTYDEHGGFHDHVSPPTTVDERKQFQRLGFRVPSVVAGPHVRIGQGVDAQFEHVSIISTLTTLHGIAPMNDRVTATNDLSPCINPDYLGNPQPPVILPPLEVSLSDVRAQPWGEVHRAIADRADELDLPGHLDRRKETLEITERVLRRGERLGALKLTR